MAEKRRGRVAAWGMPNILTGADALSGTFRFAAFTASGRLVVEGRRSGQRRVTPDRARCGGCPAGERRARRRLDSGYRTGGRHPDLLDLLGAVSYTHLTLPTNRAV